eukprot:Gb_30556 [translate_table: standard]
MSRQTKISSQSSEDLQSKLGCKNLGKNQQCLYHHAGKSKKLGTALQLQPKGSGFVCKQLEVPALPSRSTSCQISQLNQDTRNPHIINTAKHTVSLYLTESVMTIETIRKIRIRTS